MRAATFSVVLLASIAALTCASQVPKPVAPPIARSSDGSPVCKRIEDRFLGLPVLSTAGQRATESPAFAGRWWVRSCAATRHGGTLDLRLAGPGWYFVDNASRSMTLRQQVPFDLMLDLDVQPHAQISEGIMTLWLEPSQQPRVEVTVSRDLDVQAHGIWAQFLRAMPFSPVRGIATKQFVQTATLTLKCRLRDGATFTYEVWSGQADSALGKLPPGELPPHSFDDGTVWVVNERMLLAEGANQVVGPIPHGKLTMDAKIERGAGFAYRAICSQDMAKYYPAVASGETSQVRWQGPDVIGKVAGAGEHTTGLKVDDCNFYVLVSGLPGAPTLAAVRISR